MKDEKIELKEFIKYLDQYTNELFEDIANKGGSISDIVIPFDKFGEIKSKANKIKGNQPSKWFIKNNLFKCGNCGNAEYADYNYCPNCGAIMLETIKEKQYG